MGIHFLILVLKRNLTFFSNGAYGVWGAWNILYTNVAIKASIKKKKSMFGQVGAHSLSPSPLTDSMFPNSMTVTRRTKP